MAISREEISAVVRNNEDKIHEIRQSIKNFGTSVSAAVSDSRTLVLGELYERFKKMHPSIHKFCNDPRTIDLHALTYALQRLPDEITTCVSMYVKKEPEKLDDLTGLQAVDSKARRRAVYDLGGGNLLTIARDQETDNLDIATCLAMYGIETGKIRDKFKKKPFPKIPKTDFSKDSVIRNQYMAHLANILNVSLKRLMKTNSALNHRLPHLLGNIISHEAEKVTVDFDSEFSRTDASLKAREWRKRIEKELAEYGSRPLAVISSDTNSVVNCLTGFAQDNKDMILELANENSLLENMAKDEPSFIYHLVRKLSKNPNHQDLLEQKIDYEGKLGIKMLRDEFKTGIDVHIINLDEILDKSPDKIDSRIKFDLEKLKSRGLIILNMDYSFGRQGAHNMRELCENFKDRVESISIMGKAGLTCVCNGEKI